ncbi:wax ester/triacylglycerol synthase family O-acyltransferase [Nonomuraea sp. NBC_01738]|uniref:WS/DGAT/MGAT family O-acyltransferase n=1 Tax=Nonomuraea sp. NBC_01738 TaxID=2976003 RepID=UPI002E0F4369|nr:wax ester/triacylglycerol synthase family O-acyltransferase [Nonomuraea sp. NBC_01738]
MRQLSALDAQFLNAETATTAAHVAGLAILDPLDGGLDRASLAALLADRVHLSPALSLRLHQVPFALDRPYWAPDPAFSLDNHLFETALDAPGGDRELSAVVAEIHARHLDRAHPLWEMHLITGLTGGRVAVYTKVHHAAIDGVSGAETLATLLDLTPEGCTGGDPQPATAPEEPPGLVTMLAGAAMRAATHPIQMLGNLTRAAGELDAIPLAASLPGARHIAKAFRTATGDHRDRPVLPPLQVPSTPINGPITAARELAFASLPLKDVKAVAKAHGLSVNDVVMALCASGLRGWLADHDALPDQPLIAAVPVSVRTASARDQAGNQISAMIAPMPTHLADPAERLRATGETMRTVKRRFAQSRSGWLNDLCSLLPAPLTTLAVPAVFRLASVAFPPINLIISNVPGPQFPLYLCGARVLSYYPLSVLTDMSGGVNITCFSYDGMLDFGIVACPDRVDGVEGLLSHIGRALDELLEGRESDEYRVPREG